MKQNQEIDRSTQNQTFTQRLNHLQGVVGLANWDFSYPSAETLKFHQQKAHQFRSRESKKHIGRAISVVFGAALKPLSKLYRALEQGHKNRQDIHSLLSLDEHTLKDIGITRGDVRALANHKISAQEINAQRFGRNTVKPLIANCYHQPDEKNTRKFCVNDPQHIQKSA